LGLAQGPLAYLQIQRGLVEPGDRSVLIWQLYENGRGRISTSLDLTLESENVDGNHDSFYSFYQASSLRKIVTVI
jgi:hypothetical protein